MSIRQIVDTIAKDAILADAGDLPGLVTLQEHFEQLCSELTKEGEDLGAFAPLLDVARTCVQLVEELILRQVDDTDVAIQMIRDSITQAQVFVDNATNGAAPSQITADESTVAETNDNEDDDFDAELFEAWIASCHDQLTTLEATIVGIENTDDPAELVGEARRVIHTIKGEAGVMSLEALRHHCHEVETLIDECDESRRGFPVDACLALGDWIKRYVDGLADDPKHPAPDAAAVVAAIEAARQAPPAPAAPPAVDGPVTFPSDLGMDDNLNDFLCEAREHIAAAEEALLTLEDDPEDKELINTVFRAFHTIKGVAGFMNLTPIVELAHDAETLLDHARTDRLTLDSAYLDLILKSCDLLTALIAQLEGGPAPMLAEHVALRDALKRATDGERPVAPAPIESAASSSPGEAASGPNFHPLGEILVTMGFATEEEVDAALQRQQQGATKLHAVLEEAGLNDSESFETHLIADDNAGAAMREGLVALGFIDAETLDNAVRERRESGQKLGKLLGLEPRQIAAALKTQRAERRDASTPPPAAANKGGGDGNNGNRRRVEQTVKVSTTRMDNLVTMVGELVIAHQMVVQDPAISEVVEQRFQRNVGQVGKIIRDLQSVSMSLRMVTVRGTFQKMARIVRDIAGKSGKRIQFVTEGEDTELDRTVVEEIGDPLVHMIRNSCDHGIEPAEDRAEAGKPEAGRLVLRAYHQGGSIMIEVEDDGRGLNREKILAKAVERGIVPADRDPNEISDYEVYNLVFQPGFSTADKVTDISGRGVGMDVVRRNIEALRGKVEIVSTPGKGSIFRMRLPLTMAIIDGMVVRVGSQRYVLPTLAIEQSFQPTDDVVHTTIGKGEMVQVRESLLPVYRLNRVLRMDEGINDLSEALLLVLESNDSRCCLVVDEIIGQQQVVIKTLGRGIPSPRGVSGGAILGDGRVALILDVAGIVEEATSETGPESTRVAA